LQLENFRIIFLFYFFKDEFQIDERNSKQKSELRQSGKKRKESNQHNQSLDSSLTNELMHSFSLIINDANNDDKQTLASTTPSTNPKRIQLIAKANPFTKQSPMNYSTNMILVNSAERQQEEESQNETVIKLLESNLTEHKANYHDFMTNTLSFNVCSQRKRKKNDDNDDKLIQTTCDQKINKNNINIANENIDSNRTLSDLEIINILNKFMFIMFLIFISSLNFFGLFFFPYFVYEPISIEKEF
jgi:hypothetical protein